MTGPVGTGPRAGQTDFGRQMSGRGVLPLGEALREHAWRTARAEASRFHVAMGLVGFVGGAVVVVPVVLWLASMQLAGSIAVSTQAGLVGAPGTPALVSAPTLAGREPQSAPEPARSMREKPVPAATTGHAESLEAARGLIRSGRIIVARELLARDELIETGEAAFMLAETYDPNVLAALGVTGVPADADTARRHYGAALSRGVSAAAQRLDALE